MHAPVELPPADAAGADDDNAAVASAMRSHASRLRIGSENHFAVRKLSPSRGIQIARLAGSRQCQTRDNPSKVGWRQSRLAHALGCGLEDRSKALIDSEANVGGAPSPFTERYARQAAKAGSAAAAAAVD